MTTSERDIKCPACGVSGKWQPQIEFLGSFNFRFLQCRACSRGFALRWTDSAYDSDCKLDKTYPRHATISTLEGSGHEQE